MANITNEGIRSKPGSRRVRGIPGTLHNHMQNKSATPAAKSVKPVNTINQRGQTPKQVARGKRSK